jgi:hypothetical protein
MYKRRDDYIFLTNFFSKQSAVSDLILAKTTVASSSVYKADEHGCGHASGLSE